MVNGNKTFIAAGLLGAFAVIGGLIGQLEPEQAVALILEALAIAGLRHSIKKLH